MDASERQEVVGYSLVQALDGLRDGLRPFVLQILENKEGPRWYAHPRVQRLVSAPPALGGESPYGSEGPVLDLALLLKLIGSDSYWYRTFRQQLPGISRWQIDSLRELRNRVAHNDGEDPLFTTPSRVIPYLNTMEQLLHVVGSEQVQIIIKIRSDLQHRRRKKMSQIALGQSRWSVPFWLATASILGACMWLADYSFSPRVDQETIVIGTPDSRLTRYRSLEQHLQSRLRPASILRALRGDKVAVRLEGARSYPEAVANLRARRWDVLMGFSPVVSMESIEVGYRPIGVMFPHDRDYRSILFTRQDAKLQDLEDITPGTRVALGDFFSATKYYVPMSLLKGRKASIAMNLSTEEIVQQVRSGASDVGAIAGHPHHFKQLNPGLRVLKSSTSLPQSLVALSPDLSDLDRHQLQRALFQVPDSIRGRSAANYGPGQPPDYRAFARQVAEAKAFSSCLHHDALELILDCSSAERVWTVKGWIDTLRPEQDHVRISLSTSNQRALSIVITRPLLEMSAVFKVLDDLQGRPIQITATQSTFNRQAITIKTPHQIDIEP